MAWKASEHANMQISTATGLPRQDVLTLRTSEVEEVWAEGVYRLPHAFYNIVAKEDHEKVQTLGELRMRDTANWWSGLFLCVYPRFPASSSRIGGSDMG